MPTSITTNLANIPTSLISVLTMSEPKNSPGSNFFVYETSKRRQGEKKVLRSSGMEKNLYVAQKKFEKIPKIFKKAFE